MRRLYTSPCAASRDREAHHRRIEGFALGLLETSAHGVPLHSSGVSAVPHYRMRRDDDNNDGVSIDARLHLISLTPTRQFGRDTLMRWSLDPLRDGRIWPGQSQLHADFPVGSLTVVLV